MRELRWKSCFWGDASDLNNPTPCVREYPALSLWINALHTRFAHDITTQLPHLTSVLTFRAFLNLLCGDATGCHLMLEEPRPPETRASLKPRAVEIPRVNILRRAKRGAGEERSDEDRSGSQRGYVGGLELFWELSPLLTFCSL